MPWGGAQVGCHQLVEEPRGHLQRPSRASHPFHVRSRRIRGPRAGALSDLLQAAHPRHHLGCLQAIAALRAPVHSPDFPRARRSGSHNLVLAKTTPCEKSEPLTCSRYTGGMATLIVFRNMRWSSEPRRRDLRCLSQRYSTDLVVGIVQSIGGEGVIEGRVNACGSRAKQEGRPLGRPPTVVSLQYQVCPTFLSKGQSDTRPN